MDRLNLSIQQNGKILISHDFQHTAYTPGFYIVPEPCRKLLRERLNNDHHVNILGLPEIQCSS